MYAFISEIIIAEVQGLKDIALQLAVRDDLRIGKVSKRDLVKKYKLKMDSEWFDEFSSSSVVLIKKQRDTNKPKSIFYDLSSETSSVYDWINDESLEPLEELSGGSYKIGDLIKKPMFLAFINRKNPEYAEKSNDLYNNLSKIAPLYPQFIFMFTEDSKNEAKKRYLGVYWKEEPALALNYMQGSGSIVFPRKKPLTITNIKQFINSYINGEIEATTTAYDLDNQYLHSMPSVSHLDLNNFEKVCLLEGKDTLLLLYDSMGNEVHNDMAAKLYEKTANRFKHLDIDSVVIAAYDIFEHSLPREIEFTQDLPQLIFFPAFHKAPPYRYFQDIRTERLMRHVQESADIKFELPHDFHLNDEEKQRFQAGMPLEDL